MTACTIEPLYPRAAGAEPVAGARPARPGQVMQRVDHPDPAAANKQALRRSRKRRDRPDAGLRRRGRRATATASTAPRRRSRACSTASFSMPASPSNSTSAAQHKDAGAISPRWSKKRGIDPADDHDPLRLRPARRHGARTARRRCHGARSRRFARHRRASSAAQGFAGPFAVADGRVVHTAGGSEAQELAFALAQRGRLICARSNDAGIALDAARG